MDENEIYEALGMTPPQEVEPPDSSDTPQDGGAPEGNGAETGRTAEGAEGPDGGTGDEHVSDLDTSAEGGAAGPVAAGAEGSEEPGASPTESAAGKAEAPADQEARWRALVQQETQRAVEAERARNQAEWAEFFASAGLKNGLDGDKPINSLEEFRAWKTAYDRAKLEQTLSEGRLTPETLAYTIREAMAQQPKVPPADITGTPGPASGPPEVTKEQIDAELAEIHRLDGSVNGLEDILKLETAGAFREAVGRGHSFLDAFKLANFDRIQERRQAEAAQRAAQAARNNARSKEHLLPSGGKAGEGSVAVPGDVMEMYRVMMPGASETDIAAHYNRTKRDMES